MKHCNKCGAKLKANVKFCTKCGVQFKNSKPTHHKEEGAYLDLNILVNLFQNKNIFIWGGLFFFLLMIMPTKTYTYQVEVPYQTTETYTEKEPYEVQVTYQKQVPYEATETYYDSVPVQQSVPYQEIEYYNQVYNAPSGQVYNSIPNSCSCSDSGGFFWTQCIQLTCRESRYVTKYRIETVQQQIQKQRSVTKYQTVTDYRTETQYRDVEKTRDVMKTRMETRYTQQNWIFGFNVHWNLNII